MRARGAYTHAYRGYIYFLHRICTSTIAPDRRIPMEREKDIEANIRREIMKMGGMFLKFVSPGNDGVPDRIAIFPDGRIIFVELKTQHGKLSQIQAYQIDRLLNLNQQVCVVYGKYGAEIFLKDMREHVVQSMAYHIDLVLPLEEVL